VAAGDNTTIRGMIAAAHTIIFAEDADQARAFLRAETAPAFSTAPTERRRRTSELIGRERAAATPA
jgi:hypothetical protein